MKKLRIWLRSIRGRLSMTILLTCLITFSVVAVITYQITKQNIERNIIETGTQMANADTASAQSFLDYARKSVTNLYYSISIYNVVRQSDISLQNEKDIQNFLRAAIDISTGTEQVHLNLYNSGKSITLGMSGSTIRDGCYPVPLPEDITPFHAFLELPHKPHSYGTGMKTNPDEEVFTLHWNIYGLTGSIYGSLSLDFRTSTLQTLLLTGERSASVYILSGDGGIVLGDTAAYDEGTVRTAFSNAAENGWARFSMGSVRGYAFVGTAEIPGVEWQIVELIPDSTAYADSYILLGLNIMVPVLACAVSLVVILHTLRRATKPLLQIRTYVMDLKKQSHDINIRDYTDYQYDDEIGAIIECMDDMIRTRNEMFQRQLQLSKTQRAAETRMLLSQINPHFLYNILQSIGTLALQRQQKDLYEIISMLGASMHYSMNLGEEIVPLSAEAKYARQYLALQNVRFGEKISFSFQIEEQTGECTVPKMILQPMIENSFKHGKINELPVGRVRVRAFIENDILTITVEDNGRGMAQAEYRNLNEKLCSAQISDIQSEDHIGLLNIVCRMKLLYGDAVKMEVFASELGGVSVRTRLPLAGCMDVRAFYSQKNME